MEITFINENGYYKLLLFQYTSNKWKLFILAKIHGDRENKITNFQ